MSLTLSLFLFCLKGYVSPIYASAEFTTSFVSTYTIGDTSNTHVVHDIQIKNNLAHIYTTKYTLAVGSDRVTSIETRVSGSKVTSSINQNGAATSITIEIPSPVIGKDQVTKIEISYDSPDIATQLGDTLTINIPRMSKANEAESFTRIVKVPQSAAVLSSVSPKGHGEQIEDGQTIYTFIGHGNESITMLFGESVSYKLNLTYEITNPTVSTKETEIALPPDTPYQKILLDQLDPAPSAIRLDKDGNWLATYTLKSQEKKTIHAVLYATVSAIPKYLDPSGHGKELLESKEYWDTKSQLTSDLGKQLKTPRNIYDYLVDNFSYNYSRVKDGATRLGSTQGLENPLNALCTEFTDAFVALARNQGILAREVDGYAYSDNVKLRPLSIDTDILHSWPEYYDPSSFTWISIDPTWGNTTGGVNYFDKLDFNHIVFVRHGQESSYPLPAGAYKKDSSAKQILVEVSTPPPSVETTQRLGDTLKNIGNVAINDPEYGYLPPYGSQKLSQKTTTASIFNPRYFQILVFGLIILVVGSVIFLVKRKK